MATILDPKGPPVAINIATDGPGRPILGGPSGEWLKPGGVGAGAGVSA